MPVLVEEGMDLNYLRTEPNSWLNTKTNNNSAAVSNPCDLPYLTFLDIDDRKIVNTVWINSTLHGNISMPDIRVRK